MKFQGIRGHFVTFHTLKTLLKENFLRVPSNLQFRINSKRKVHMTYPVFLNTVVSSVQFSKATKIIYQVFLGAFHSGGTKHP